MAWILPEVTKICSDPCWFCPKSPLPLVLSFLVYLILPTLLLLPNPQPSSIFPIRLDQALSECTPTIPDYQVPHPFPHPRG